MKTLSLHPVGAAVSEICYRIGDIEATVAELRKQRMIVLCEPVAAPAFSRRRIAWLLGQDRVPVGEL